MPITLDRHDTPLPDGGVRTDQFTTGDVPGYVAGCAAKQLGLSKDEAAKFAAKLNQDRQVAITNAGRRGDVAEVVRLLNGGELAAVTDEAPAADDAQE